ncbi:MAG: hypothetical protein HY360_18925 [Verrucomicrobia bacterium]|nr:hypothetical protein [Verrucomicrobiota bacterium]
MTIHQALFLIPFLVFSGLHAEEGLVLHYDFNEGTGATLKDRGGQKRDGKINGAEYVQEADGCALKFDGVRSYVDCGTDNQAGADWNITNAVTVEAWIKPDDEINVKVSDAGIVIKEGYFYGLTYDMRTKDQHRIAFFINHIPLSNYVRAPITAGVWQHVVGVFDGSRMRVFVDGDLKSSNVSKVGRIDAAPNSIFIGKNVDQYFSGLIDEVRIYNRVLTEGEILQHYRTGARARGKEIVTTNKLKLTPQLRYVQGALVVNVNFKELWPLPEEGLTATVELFAAGGKQPLQKESIALAASSVQTDVSFAAARLNPGDYEIRAAAKGQKDAPVGESAVAKVAWPRKPRWLGSTEGKGNQVLPPWTPVKVNQRRDALTIGTWGRSYEFSANPFPSRIESKGRDLLTKPVRLNAKVNGRVVEWQTVPIKLGKKSADSVAFVQHAAGGGLTLSVETRVEYDGMACMDWKIHSSKKATLERLALEIRLPSSCAKYLYQYPGPWGSEMIRNARALPAEGFAYRFTPFVWLGDEERGLAWFAESDANWTDGQSSKAIEIARENDAPSQGHSSPNNVILRLNLITQSIELTPDRPLAYTFGLQATPVKPVIKDAWDYRISAPLNYGYDYAALTNAVGSTNEIDYLADLGVKTIFITNWTDILCSLAPVGHSDDLRQLVKRCHAKGIQVLIYTGYQISERNPEWPAFGDDVRKAPMDRREESYPGQKEKQAMHIVCYQGAWQDYLVDGIARLMDQYDVDGVYIDTMLASCHNPQHGCGYTNDAGRIVNTWPIFALRQTWRRIYTAVKTRKPEGQVNIHNSTCMVIPALAWATSYWDGEQMYAYKEKEGQLAMDLLPLDMFRTEFMGRQWGVPAEFLNLAHIMGDYRSIFALTLLHDVLPRAFYNKDNTEFIAKVWRAGDDFGRKQAKWQPYWRNAAYVTVKPERAYASLYLHPTNGVLAVVSNLDRQQVEVRVELNADRLGLAGQASARDALTGESLPMRNGRIELSLPSLGWKLVWVK